jgi:hypothetical protein
LDQHGELLVRPSVERRRRGAGEAPARLPRAAVGAAGRLQRLADGGQRFYDRRAPEAVLRGRAGMLRLVADWGAAALVTG